MSILKKHVITKKMEADETWNKQIKLYFIREDMRPVNDETP